jgi:hypothetical protein
MLDADGNLTNTDVRVTDNTASSQHPSIVSTGFQSFNIAFQDGRSGNKEIYMAWISGGNVLGEQRITDNPAISAAPRLSFTGSEFGVIWYDNRSGNFEIYFARTRGVVVDGSAVRISNDSALSEWPSIVWNGESYRIIWQDARDGQTEVYISGVQCCPDADADGYSVCQGDNHDNDPGIHPGAVETCDGADNDGNGSLDEICDGTCDSPSQWGPELKMTDDATDSTGPSLAWNGAEYGLAWKDARDGNNEIYFRRVGADGTALGSDLRVTSDAGSSTGPSLVWNGVDYGLFWTDSRSGTGQLWFTTIDPAGSSTSPKLRVSETTSTVLSSSVVWAGDRYGVVWSDNRDGNYEVYFARYDKTGTQIGHDVRLTDNAGNSWNVKLAWSGSDYGVTWRNEASGIWSVYYQRFDAAGNPLTGEILLSNGTDDAYHPGIEWNGTDYAVAWQDQRMGNNEIYFMRPESPGATPVRVTNNSSSSAAPRLAWTGAEYALSWYDSFPGNFEIYYMPLDSGGTPSGPMTRLSNGSGFSDWPTVLWTGTHFGVAWQDKRDGDYEVYFTSVKCCGNDVDADTAGSCVDCNDLNDTIYPGATELCDRQDNDCDTIIDEGFLPPSPVAGLEYGTDNDMSWDTVAEAEWYDVVKGRIVTLNSGSGDFGSAVGVCLENDSIDEASSDPEGVLSTDLGYFYLIRAQTSCKEGTYDGNPASQVGERDEEIASSEDACP